MTILEMMERANTRETNLSIAFIKDAIAKIQSSNEIVLKVDKQNITKDQRDYYLPVDIIALDSVSILDTEDGNKYKKIRRIMDDPVVTEDV
tara:strand:- start:26611 stop:26883 length:273 start_codon:yes stop_codon:yes gene_type:complete